MAKILNIFSKDKSSDILKSQVKDEDLENTNDEDVETVEDEDVEIVDEDVISNVDEIEIEDEDEIEIEDEDEIEIEDEDIEPSVSPYIKDSYKDVAAILNGVSFSKYKKSRSKCNALAYKKILKDSAINTKLVTVYGADALVLPSSKIMDSALSIGAAHIRASRDKSVRQKLKSSDSVKPKTVVPSHLRGANIAVIDFQKKFIEQKKNLRGDK